MRSKRRHDVQSSLNWCPKDYIVNGKMTGGFAILATPVKYAETGIHIADMGSFAHLHPVQKVRFADSAVFRACPN